MSHFQSVYDQAMSSPAFRSKLSSDPEGTLRSAGIQPTPEILSSVKETIEAIAALGEAFLPNPNTVHFVS